MEEVRHQMPTDKIELPKSSVPFVVVIVLAVLVGGWLYVDIVRQDLQTQIDLLRISQSRVAHKVNGGEMMKKNDAMMEKEDTIIKSDAVTGELGAGYAFSLDLPAGYKLSVSETAIGSDRAYVYPEPTEDNETSLPVMSIAVVNLDNASYQEVLDNPATGRRVIVSKTEPFGYWFVLWEGLDWKPFEDVVDSFEER